MTSSIPSQPVRYWRAPDEHEQSLFENGVPDIVSSLTFQLPAHVFFGRTWNSFQRVKVALMQVQMIHLLIAAAQKAGAVIVLEELLATRLEVVVAHRTMIRVHLIVHNHEQILTIERFVANACTGEALLAATSERLPNNRLRTVPPESWMRMTVATLQVLAGLERFNDASPSTYNEYVNRPDLAGNTSAGSGIFHAFYTIRSMPVYQNHDAVTSEVGTDTISVRFHTCGVQTHPRFDHDPRRFDSYIRVDPDGVSKRWRPDPEWAERHTRILDFRSNETLEKPYSWWFIDTEMLDGVGLPWETPSVAELKLWLMTYTRNATSADGTDVFADMTPENIADYMRLRDPWTMGSPVMMDTVVYRPLVPQDHRHFPSSEKLHRRIITFLHSVEVGVQAGVLEVADMRGAHEWSIGLCRMLFCESAPAGYSPMPSRVYAELVASVQTFNAAVLYKQGASEDERARKILLRSIAWLPGHGLENMHPDSWLICHLAEAMWSHVGSTPSQTGAFVFMASMVGHNMRPAWVKKGNYILLAGPPGGGKSHVLIWLRLIIPSSMLVDLGSITTKMMYYSKSILDQYIAVIDEMYGQLDKTETDKVMIMNEVVSAGELTRLVTAFNPTYNDKNCVESMGSVVSVEAAARVTVLTAANKSPDDAGRGADASRRVTLQIIPGQERGETTEKGRAIMKAECMVRQMVTAGVGYALSLSGYGASGMVSVPESTVFAVFMRAIVPNTPALSSYTWNNRARQALLEVAQQNWWTRTVWNYMLSIGRVSPDRALKRVLNTKHPLVVRMPDTPEFAAITRRTTMSAIDVIGAVSFMPAEQNESVNKFYAWLISKIHWSNDRIGLPESPDDDGYVQLTIQAKGSGKIADSFGSLEKFGIPNFYKDEIVSKAETEGDFEKGATALKVETTTTENSKTPRVLLLHQAVLSRGYRYITPGQMCMMSELLMAPTFYSYPDQSAVCVGHEATAALRDSDLGKFNRNQLMKLVDLWLMPDGTPCVWRRGERRVGSAIASVLEMTGSEVVPPGTLDGDGVAAIPSRTNGPLHVLPADPPHVIAKVIKDGMGVNGQFWEWLPDIARGQDVMVGIEAEQLDTHLNRFCLMCGVKPGIDVWAGCRSHLQRSDPIARVLRVRAESFAYRVPNPNYSARADMFGHVFGARQASGPAARSRTGLSILAGDSDEYLTFSDTSNIGALLLANAELADDERLLVRMGNDDDNSEEDLSDEDDDDGGAPPPAPAPAPTPAPALAPTPAPADDYDFHEEDESSPPEHLSLPAAKRHCAHLDVADDDYDAFGDEEEDDDEPAAAAAAAAVVAPRGHRAVVFDSGDLL
jgi:hypothetical protein